MRYQLLILCASPLALAGCTALSDFLATPEGQDAAEQTARGAAGAATNPANILAWYDLVVGAAIITAGALGYKGVAKGAKAAADVVKKRVLNPPVDPATNLPVEP
jgi:hypothetical protein